jgi:hypothetical protein
LEEHPAFIFRVEMYRLRKWLSYVDEFQRDPGERIWKWDLFWAIGNNG